MAEPVSLAEIKVHCRIAAEETGEDTNLTAMIVAARRACELRTRRTIVGAARSLVLGGFPVARGPIALPGGTVSAVEVRYYDADGTDVLLDGIATVTAPFSAALTWLEPVAAWPATADRVDAARIAYTVADMAAGDLEMVRHAIRLIVGHWHQNREAVVTGAISAELPVAVDWLLDPLTAWGVT